MKACPSCGAWIPDEAASCPNCGAEVRRADAPPPLPAPPAPPGTGLPGGPEADAVADFERRRAEDAVRILGTLYVVAGALALAVVTMVFGVIESGAALEAVEKTQREHPEVDPAAFRFYREILLDRHALGAGLSAWFLLGVLWIWSGVRLRSLQGRGLALLGAVLLLVPC